MDQRRFLDSLRPRLVSDPLTRMVPRETAAVAVIFLVEKGRERILLIRRAERDGDPWSNHMAFPGGMVGPEDSSFEETAKREANEEVGVDLSPDSASFLGYMLRLKARLRDVTVVPAVFELNSRPELKPNNEVASCEWALMEDLAREDARSTYLVKGPLSKEEVTQPALVHHGNVIWGLTERIISAIIAGGPLDSEG
jgi:8-oxo-dGTP pyrophosphatase MutT (NUDIX family)